ncbi:MAG: diguanylate cyclase [Gammaproteobacteria bacterium]|nr:diguanylate cyclase [Gammaproteobacteria bacterium]MCW8973820.1 diguanylate cyclase [Gammaproteobacteria bacterium]MCW8993965.1 diguanylate cyclase [Gammaproteobacteria bacterium]
MYRSLFQALTTNELEQYASELDKAVEDHARWLARINRALICHLPPDSEEVGETPHRLCHFGRWYHGIDNPYLAGAETFIRIGDIHEKMHLSAKRLLLKSGPIHVGEYDELVVLAGQLRNLANTLHDELRHNSNLVSKLMTKVFDNAKEAVLITAPDGTIINVNSAFSEVTGYSEEEAIGNTPKLLQSSIHGADFYEQMWQELRNYGRWQGEIWNRRKSGENYLEWLSIAAVHDKQGKLSHYVAIFADITSEKENKERLQYLAHYDQLTHLPNRILFNDRMRQALAQAKREQRQVAVMFLDLDGFKEVNDSLGHNAGDEMLRQVAQRLEDCLRATDTVARFGGDEFTIVLPEIDNRHSVIRIANKIGEEIAKPYTLDGQEAHITTSIGISLYPDDSEAPEKLLDYADNAMYHAKRHGKNHHEFYIGEG